MMIMEIGDNVRLNRNIKEFDGQRLVKFFEEGDIGVVTRVIGESIEIDMPNYDDKKFWFNTEDWDLI